MNPARDCATCFVRGRLPPTSGLRRAGRAPKGARPSVGKSKQPASIVAPVAAAEQRVAACGFSSACSCCHFRSWALICIRHCDLACVHQLRRRSHMCVGDCEQKRQKLSGGFSVKTTVVSSFTNGLRLESVSPRCRPSRSAVATGIPCVRLRLLHMALWGVLRFRWGLRALRR